MYVIKKKQLSNFTSHVIQDGRSRQIYWEFGKHDLQTSSGYNEMKIYQGNANMPHCKMN